MKPVFAVAAAALIGVAAAMVFLIMLQPTGPSLQGPVACTLEAKICPDGTAVGRVGPNCEFAPCPPGGPTDFESCVAAGNPVMESYPRLCKVPNGTVFTEGLFEDKIPPQSTGQPGEAPMSYCKPEQRDAQACPTLYKPVCGWFNQSIKCFAYPCAQTFDNSCFACADPKVEYWTEGKCPPVGGVPS